MPVAPPSTIYQCLDSNGNTVISSTPCVGMSVASRPNVTTTAPPASSAGSGSSFGEANPLTNSAVAKITTWAANSANWKHVGLLLAGGILIVVAIVAFGSSTKAGQTIIKTGGKLAAEA